MEVKVLALRALKEIIDEKTSFQIVLERILKEYNLSIEDKKLLKLNVLGSIRHFYFLRYEATTALPEYDADADEIYLIILSLHEIRYHSKKIALYQSIESATNAADFMNLKISAEKINEVLTYLQAHKTPIPEELKKDPYAYNSLFFSMPLWLVRMWAEQYGDEKTMDILLNSQRKANTYLAINTLRHTQDDYASDKRFVVKEAASTALLYNYPTPCSELEEVQQGDLYVQDLAIQAMLDEIEYPYQTRALHIGAVTGGLVTNLATRLQNKYGTCEAIFANERRYRQGRYLLARTGIKNTECHLGPLKLTKTYCPYGEYDLVVVTPPNSYLGQMQKRPDIVLTLQRDDIATITKRESEFLEEASHFVNKQGHIVYAIQTMNLREGEEVIKEFLKTHEDFIIIKKRQIFPMEYNSDGLFYAILRKI